MELQSEFLKNTIVYDLLKQREIVISEPITSRVAERVINQLLWLEQDDAKKPIYMWINSPGGEVNSGFAIYDTLRFVSPEIHCISVGLTASIATVIALAAKKQFRYTLPSTRFLIHQPLINGVVQGQASDIAIHAREIVKTRNRIIDLYHQETNIPKEKIEKDINRDNWMNAQEYIDYGLVTKIIQSRADFI